MKKDKMKMRWLLILLAALQLTTYAEQLRAPPKYNEEQLHATFNGWIASIDTVALATAYPQAIKDLLTADKQKQLTATRILGDTSDIRAIPWLLPYLDAQDSEVRIWAGSALQKIVSAIANNNQDNKQTRIAELKPIAWLVLQMLRSPDDGNTGAYAAQMAALLGLTEFEAELMGCTRSVHPAVSDNARAALKTLGIKIE